MQNDLEEEVKLFCKEIERAIRDKQEQEYIKEKFLNFVENNIKKIMNVIDDREAKFKELSEKSEILQKNMTKLEDRVDYIVNDLYEQEDEVFEVICPYCNFTFEADISEEIKEIKCPECENIIELDWNGNDNDDGCCGNGCSHCKGCE